ncbi:MAG: GldG family protein [Oscillospiraceae bacterium]|nr:GldG family protein [Oscillospiraceae bacterium]
MKNIKKFTKIFTSKKFKHGGLSILLTVIFITGVVLVNIIAGMLLERFDVKVDTSANRIFSIEEDTAAFLRDLDDEVTLTVLSRENDFITEGGFSEFYNQTNEILKRFAAASNGKITIHYLDLASNPDFADKYENALSPTSIIVESKTTLRHRILNDGDYLEVSYFDPDGNPVSEEYAGFYSMYGMLQTDVSAAAERELLSAILAVSDVEPTHVAFAVTGFNESKNEFLEELLSMNAYNVSEIDMVKTVTIEPELDFIIIDSPTADYTDAALEKLNNWLNNDGLLGKTLIYITHESASTPNLDAFLESHWGIQVERAFVFQRDPRYATADQALQINVQYYQPQEYLERLNPNFEIHGELMRKVNRVFEERSNMRTFSLLSSYEGSVVLPFEALAEGVDWNPDMARQGAFDVAVQSSKIRYETDGLTSKEITSNVIVFGGGRRGGNALNPYFMAQRNNNNTGFFINMMATISGKTVNISVAPKSFIVTSFQITAENARIIALVFMLFLPVAVVATGIIVWFKRSRI